MAHFIRRAMERGDLGRFDALEEDVLAGKALLWVAIVSNDVHAALVTQVVLTELSKVCMIQACGGNGLNNWLRLLPIIETYARSQKCDCIRLMGRKGWARMLDGYTIEKVVMERRL